MEEAGCDLFRGSSPPCKTGAGKGGGDGDQVGVWGRERGGEGGGDQGSVV